MTNKLLLRATYYAFCYQRSLLEAIGNCNEPCYVKEREGINKFLKDIKAYRLKRWGIPLDSISYK